MGELLTLKNLETIIHRLDEEEDFEGYESTASLYRRVLVETQRSREKAWAWAYRYVGSHDIASHIISGDWRKR